MILFSYLENFVWPVRCNKCEVHLALKEATDFDTVLQYLRYKYSALVEVLHSNHIEHSTLCLYKYTKDAPSYIVPLLVHAPATQGQTQLSRDLDAIQISVDSSARFVAAIPYSTIQRKSS